MALTKSIDETSVLYALVQLNKAARDNGRASEFKTINLYRDWLVHTDLDHNKSLTEFFEQWDKIIESIHNRIGIDHATEKSIEPLKFDYLFEELASLGVNLQANDRNFFIRALVGNLLDTPLRWPGNHIKEFRFTFDDKKKETYPTYFCHMQIQHTSGKWFNGPELHYP